MFIWAIFKQLCCKCITISFSMACFHSVEIFGELFTMVMMELQLPLKLIALLARITRATRMFSARFLFNTLNTMSIVAVLDRFTTQLNGFHLACRGVSPLACPAEM